MTTLQRIIPSFDVLLLVPPPPRTRRLLVMVRMHVQAQVQVLESNVMVT